MEAQVLEPRPLYGIGTVARLTGLKPVTVSCVTGHLSFHKIKTKSC